MTRATYNLINKKTRVVEEILVMGSKQIEEYAKSQNIDFERAVRIGGLNN